VPERVIGGDLDEHDTDPIGIFDPHLNQTPRLGAWLLDHADADRGQPLMLSVDIPDLDPDHQRCSRRLGRTPGHLKKARAEEEHQPRAGWGTELTVDRQAEHVTVEPVAPVKVCWAQKDSATQDVHRKILTTPR
jgi:hypothetical protein